MISIIRIIFPSIFPSTRLAYFISHFFRVYKSLEGKETVVNEVLGPDEAKEVIKNCIAAYKDMYC